MLQASRITVEGDVPSDNSLYPVLTFGTDLFDGFPSKL
jgi:hypothetical protein